MSTCLSLKHVLTLPSCGRVILSKSLKAWFSAFLFKRKKVKIHPHEVHFPLISNALGPKKLVFLENGPYSVEFVKLSVSPVCITQQKHAKLFVFQSSSFMNFSLLNGSTFMYFFCRAERKSHFQLLSFEVSIVAECDFNPHILSKFEQEIRLYISLESIWGLMSHSATIDTSKL